MRVVIVGGGASGIACAVRLKQNNANAEVTVLEHLDEICKKLHATGNGRCNMTNTSAEHFEVTKEFFSSIGIVMRTDGEGRVYPYSNQASSVVEALISACNKYGVKIVTDCHIRKAEHIGETYNIYSDKGIFSSEVLILATGGMSQSALGSDGSGYDIARELGHTICELSPALVMLKSSSKHCRALKGIRTKCNIKIETNGEIVGEDSGELLFADYGISGIVVMNLSKYVNDERLEKGRERTVAIIDFVPEMNEEQLRNHYDKFATFSGILPTKLCSVFERQADSNVDKIIKCIKSWRLIITGTKGFNFAQITKGGVPNAELKKANESIYHDALYIVGELTDNQFDCGGFNLDYAFSSGILTADDINNRYSKKYYD